MLNSASVSFSAETTLPYFGPVSVSAKFIKISFGRSLSQSDNIVMCGYCHGFYSKPFLHWHKTKCSAAEASGNVVSVPLSGAAQHSLDDDFCKAFWQNFNQILWGKSAKQWTRWKLMGGISMHEGIENNPSSQISGRVACEICIA